MRDAKMRIQIAYHSSRSTNWYSDSLFEVRGHDSSHAGLVIQG